MKNLWRNERGAALILVLMLSMVVTVGLTALIMSTQQGQRNSVHDGNAERSNYVAESGAVIVKRLVKNAAANNVQVQSMEESQLKTALEKVNPSFSLSGSNAMEISSRKEAGQFVVEITGKSKYSDNLKRQTKITLPILLNTSGGGAGGNGKGIFGDDVVGTSVTETNKAKTEAWVRHWDGKVQTAPGQYYKIINYQEQMTKYFTQQVDTKRPVFKASTVHPLQAPGTPATPLDVFDNKNCAMAEFQRADLEKYPDIYCLGDITINPAGLTKGTTIYSNGTIRVRGDLSAGTTLGALSAGKDIVFEGKLSGGKYGELIAGGKVIFSGELNSGFTHSQKISARGSIEFANKLNGAVFSGEMVSGDSIYFKNVIGNVTYSGRVSAANNIVFQEKIEKAAISADMVAGNNMQFKRPVGENGPVTISGSLMSGGSMTFDEPVRNLTASARFVAGKAITFNKEVGSGVLISGSLHSHDTITFNEPITSSTIMGLYAKGNIVLWKAVQGNSATLGDIQSDANITFNGNFDNATVLGDVIANKLLAFNGNINGSTVFKKNLVSNSTVADLNFNAGYRVVVEQSIYSAKGIDFKQLNGVRVGQSIYAYQNVTMPVNLSYLNIDGALLSRDGSVTFPKLYGCNSKDDCFVGSFIAGTAGIAFNYNLDGFMYFGGLSTGQTIKYNGNQNGPPNTIRITRQAPDGYTEDSGGNNGQINFGDWRTTS
ncbi:hypothetical protein SAMN02799630_00241 [Paenibacillus sp. UNCCL117]|uniref:hypothetical protein n=1 Tax=unclassified Paenibacillus TaxID=185978 RepID=UPI00088BF105|nr:MULTISPECIES: hypothetical protein [unclassified Paenibacillus]SDC47094.1 hypothetical protein SAMN04488602_102291 [Paenibacillus sp. cl123]SFW12194.1 hypothetical protein SAMN02799630_00241 [Paenibacillus sp. UNCCL117]